MGRPRLFAIGVRIISILVIVASLTVAANVPAHAARTFTVNQAGNQWEQFQKQGDGRCDWDVATPGDQCTLASAIQEANKSRGHDRIQFNIPGTGPHTISPGLSAQSANIPPVTKPVTIDGYTQPGTSVNTLPLANQGTNAVLKIKIDGTDAGAHGRALNLYPSASGSVIRGLAITRFQSAIQAGLREDGSNYRIEGNFIGTDPTGTAAEGNTFGVWLDGVSSTLGGTTPAARNLISGNTRTPASTGATVGAITLAGRGRHTVQGNVIGVHENGSTAIPNGFNGFRVESSSNVIGDAAPTGAFTAASNVIAFSGLDGVWISNPSDRSHVGNRVLSNTIYGSGDLGIDLGGNGVTANDLDDPGTSRIDPDTDGGPNRLQNYPVITAAQRFGGEVVINGVLDSTRSTSRRISKFIVQVFASSTPDPSTYGEGQRLLAQVSLKTDRAGHASFAFAVPTAAITTDEYVTATATDKATGDTSEFSQARRVMEAVGPPMG